MTNLLMSILFNIIYYIVINMQLLIQGISFCMYTTTSRVALETLLREIDVLPTVQYSVT